MNPTEYLVRFGTCFQSTFALVLPIQFHVFLQVIDDLSSDSTPSSAMRWGRLFGTGPSRRRMISDDFTLSTVASLTCRSPKINPFSITRQRAHSDDVVRRPLGPPRLSLPS
jgi:hypothetical protein